MDVYQKFRDQCQLEILLLEHVMAKGTLKADRQVWLSTMKGRLLKLDQSRKYRDIYLQRLMLWGGMKVGRPSRLTSMTIAEEKLGWQVTMKSWDYALWLAGLASVEDLRGHVALPQQLVDRRKDVALVFSDQVPVWLKIGQRKIVLAGHEQVLNSKRSKIFKEAWR
jgi:hypothetical protein